MIIVVVTSVETTENQEIEINFYSSLTIEKPLPKKGEVFFMLNVTFMFFQRIKEYNKTINETTKNHQTGNQQRNCFFR